MSFSLRSPFALSDNWAGSGTIGATSFNQDWVEVGVANNHRTASAPYGFTLFGQMTIVGENHNVFTPSYPTGFNAKVSDAIELAGQRYYTHGQTYTSSSDQSIASVSSGENFQAQTRVSSYNLESVNDHSRLMIFAIKES